jgi:hypothetical protein
VNEDEVLDMVIQMTGVKKCNGQTTGRRADLDEGNVYENLGFKLRRSKLAMRKVYSLLSGSFHSLKTVPERLRTVMCLAERRTTASLIHGAIESNSDKIDDDHTQAEK